MIDCGTSYADEVKWITRRQLKFASGYPAHGNYCRALRQLEGDSAYDLDTKEDDEDVDDFDDKEEKAAVPEMATPDTPEGATVATTRSGGVKSLTRNLVEELDEVAGLEPAYPDDDGDDDVYKLRRNTERGALKPRSDRPPLNGDTPISNKLLERCMEMVMAETQVYPTQAALRDWSPPEAGTDLQKWKKKLRMASVATNSGAGRSQRLVKPVKLLTRRRSHSHRLPRKVQGEVLARNRQIFASTERSPYFQDSHMVTPRSSRRAARRSRENDRSRPTRSTQHGSSRRPGWRLSGRDDSDDDDDDLFGLIGDGDDLAAEFARQIEEARCMRYFR
ncbi:hypothetical protein F443_22828 [Phytophthora nicotianae P1569]|uniref:Uncharacterized protein n=2 Tax=Phytophthora nicotianae TaxID=4792 RepID=V9DT27_PHYNI|nr:hypothetical protein F443_22828 [Phytophthora nicotianae P1569]